MSCRYGFVELKLSTPKALHTIRVLVTVADGSIHDEGGVVSTGCMLDVGEGPCVLLLGYVLQQRKSLKKYPIFDLGSLKDIVVVV